MIRTNENLKEIERFDHNTGIFETLLSIKSLLEDIKKNTNKG